MRWIPAALLVAQTAFCGPAGEIARAINELAFDIQECWRVRDLTLFKEDGRIYLTDGYLMFGKPVAGRRIAALFTTDVPGGDGEIILLPPDRGERRSLASYTGTPNLDEHIAAALMLFTDDTYERLLEQMPQNPTNRKVPEIGALLAERWAPTLRNLGVSFSSRIALDLLTGRSGRGGLFAAMLQGRKLDNFDFIYEPRHSEQILLGQVATRGNRTFFDTWASFAARSTRMGGFRPPAGLALADYRIEATVETDLNLQVVTRVTATPDAETAHVLPFDIAHEMRITGATIDGRPAEVLQRDSLRANLIRASGNDLVLIVPPEPLTPGRACQVEIRHAGKVIVDTGQRIYYVTARANWYPTSGLEFARYDLLFRYPRELDLVTPGEVVEDKTEGAWRITRRRTGTPIRIAGFNLGRYAHTRVAREGYTVEICANKVLEAALQPRPTETLPLPAQILGRRPRAETVLPPPPLPVSPAARLEELAAQFAGALGFMAGHFGPPALPSVTVSPLPGTFGQGFPGLIYLPTLSYLETQPRLDAQQQLFFGEILQAHETAHQWWGNVVVTSGYHDGWISEALANYSALLYLEKRKGARSVESVLAHYRDQLLLKSDNGQTVDAAGPIVFGGRLESSQEPRAWRAITYGKGTWILHMLRRRMGDERFLAMLREVRRRYEYKELSTAGFRELAAGFLPPRTGDSKLEVFFDQWVYGTGIPDLKLVYAIRGKAPAWRVTGTVTQTEVDGNFAAAVPVEIQLGRGKTVTHWVIASSEPNSFSVPVAQAPVKVSLGDGVLRR